MFHSVEETPRRWRPSGNVKDRPLLGTPKREDPLQLEIAMKIDWWRPAGVEQIFRFSLFCQNNVIWGGLVGTRKKKVTWCTPEGGRQWPLRDARDGGCPTQTDRLPAWWCSIAGISLDDYRLICHACLDWINWFVDGASRRVSQNWYQRREDLSVMTVDKSMVGHFQCHWNGWWSVGFGDTAKFKLWNSNILK